MAAPEPGSGEVRVRGTLPGVNPGDTKKRGDRVGSGLPFPRIVPHSDGAGIIDHIAEAHDRVDGGTRERVLLAIAS
jgi:NADPH2:quinone reductase